MFDGWYVFDLFLVFYVIASFSTWFKSELILDSKGEKLSFFNAWVKYCSFSFLTGIYMMVTSSPIWIYYILTQPKNFHDVNILILAILIGISYTLSSISRISFNNLREKILNAIYG